MNIEQEKMIVEALPSLYPLQEFEEKAIDIVLNAIPHWNPVTERLPENNGEYLVTVKWVTGESDVDVYEYDSRHKTWNDGESAGGERAVAWAKLPEPYKGVTT